MRLLQHFFKFKLKDYETLNQESKIEEFLINLTQTKILIHIFQVFFLNVKNYAKNRSFLSLTLRDIHELLKKLAISTKKFAVRNIKIEGKYLENSLKTSPSLLTTLYQS